MSTDPYAVARIRSEIDNAATLPDLDRVWKEMVGAYAAGFVDEHDATELESRYIRRRLELAPDTP